MKAVWLFIECCFDSIADDGEREVHEVGGFLKGTKVPLKFVNGVVDVVFEGGPVVILSLAVGNGPKADDVVDEPLVVKDVLLEVGDDFIFTESKV